MWRFGTLESPYTVEYLDFLLRGHGFVDIRRYFTVNGLFPESQGGERLADVAISHPWDSNNLTARKPSRNAATMLDRHGGEPGAPDHEEAESRHRLPRTLAPGEALSLDLAYRLPSVSSEDPWLLDLVNEGIFWFSQRGTRPALLRVPDLTS